MKLILHFLIDVLKKIKQDNLSEICNCGGVYKTVVDPKQTTLKLKTYLAIAGHFKMPLLHHNIKWILNMNSIHG